MKGRGVHRATQEERDNTKGSLREIRQQYLGNKKKAPVTLHSVI